MWPWFYSEAPERVNLAIQACFICQQHRQFFLGTFADPNSMPAKSMNWVESVVNSV